MVSGASIILVSEMDRVAPRKILIVDDDELMHRLLRHHLERAGFISLHATCGRGALDVAFDEQPHVVVMDVMMEDMDGISVLKELRKNSNTQNTPVIMITATTLEIVRHESKLLGAMQYMTKPFSPAQLLAAISKVLSSSAASASGQTS